MKVESRICKGDSHKILSGHLVTLQLKDKFCNSQTGHWMSKFFDYGRTKRLCVRLPDGAIFFRSNSNVHYLNPFGSVASLDQSKVMESYY